MGKQEYALLRMHERYQTMIPCSFTTHVSPGTWKFVGSGILPMTSPKSLPAKLATEQVLAKKGWVATASVPDSAFLFSGGKIPIDISAANAIDGDHWTGWRDMTKLQYPGQRLEVDMQKEQEFNKLVLDNTWAQWDTPTEYSVTISKHGTTWSEPIATGPGQAGITTIRFPMQHARYLRVTQTGTNATYHWSVYELDVCREK